MTTGPRFSITPARFVEDARATLSHYRVLNALGRHAKANGWLRVKQQTLGTAIGLSRRTVNTTLADLVEWGYVEKRETDSTGRAIFYRILFDTLPPPSDGIDADGDDFAPAPDTPPAPSTCEVGFTGRENKSSDVRSQLHTRCEALHFTPGVKTHFTHNDYSLTPTLNVSPPLPPPSPVAGQGGGADLFAGLDAAPPPPSVPVAASAPAVDDMGTAGGQPVADLWGPNGLDVPRRWAAAADAVREIAAGHGGRRRVLERLLLPLMGALQPSPHVDPSAIVRQIANKLAGAPDAVLDAVREAIAAEWVRDLPPWPKIEPLVARAQSAHDLAIEAQRAMGAVAVAPLTTGEAAAWARVKAAFAELASPVVASTYLAVAHPVGLAGDVVTIIVPSVALKAGLDLSHTATLQAAVLRGLGRRVSVMVTTAAAHRRAA